MQGTCLGLYVIIAFVKFTFMRGASGTCQSSRGRRSGRRCSCCHWCGCGCCIHTERNIESDVELQLAEQTFARHACSFGSDGFEPNQHAIMCNASHAYTCMALRESLAPAAVVTGLAVVAGAFVVTGVAVVAAKNQRDSGTWCKVANVQQGLRCMRQCLA